MSGFTRFDLIEASIYNPFFPRPLAMAGFEAEDHLGFALGLLSPSPSVTPFEIPSSSAIRSLSDRVTALELGIAPKIRDLDRRYKWTAEIKGERVDRKCEWTAEARPGEERSYGWTAEIKGKGKEEKIYTFHASAAASKEGKGKVVIKEKEKKKQVVIEEADPGAIATQKVSQCLRDMAVAKAKLKEIRSLFHNFSYRHRIATNAEERQRFSEKIIILLLTVDAIEGVDYMVRAGKRSMIKELEVMLEVVDPKAWGKFGLMKRSCSSICPWVGSSPRRWRWAWAEWSRCSMKKTALRTWLCSLCLRTRAIRVPCVRRGSFCCN